MIFYSYLYTVKQLEIMKTVHDLSQEELEELRETYFHQLNDLGEEDFTSSQEIPMTNVICHYEGMMFVEEDFFCNIEEKKEYLTKGINHTNEIETSTYVYGTQEQQEISFKKMIISCYTYREMYSDSLTKYKEILGEELYNEILTEQVKFFDEKYIIKSGVFNDGEGCSYNSLTLKN